MTVLVTAAHLSHLEKRWWSITYQGKDTPGNHMVNLAGISDQPQNIIGATKQKFIKKQSERISDTV